MVARSLLILLLFMLSGFTGTQDEPPFIYYPQSDGYIVERADGSDSHFIDGGAGAHPAKRDASWSPSGKWLAWRAVDFAGCGSSGEPAEQLVIASAESTTLLPFDDWVRFIWSRNDDQLFIVSSDHDELLWQIIDPAAPDTPLASGSIDADAADSMTHLQDFLTSGQAEFSRNDNLDQAVPSADGQWLAYIEDGPVMVNRASGETRLIAPSIYGYGGNRGGYIKWHSSQNWFISVEEGMAGCGSSYHTQVTNGETRYELEYANQVEWLPPQVNPGTFPAFEKPAQPQPLKTLHAQQTITRLVWSADGSMLYAYTGNPDAPDPVVAWDVVSGEQLQNPIFPPIAEIPEAYFDDQRLLVESDSYIVSPSGAYDKQSGDQVVDFHVDLWTVGGIFQISSDEKVMIGSAIIKPLYIWSLGTGELLFEGLMATAAAISPDSAVVAVASGWDVHLYSADSLGF